MFLMPSKAWESRLWSESPTIWEGKGSILQGADIVAGSGANGATIGDSGGNGVKETLQSASEGKGAFVLSFFWFLYQWKANWVTYALAVKGVEHANREELLAFDRTFSVGLLLIGIVTFADVSGVSVLSVLTVGGVGGLQRAATALAAKDIFVNVFSGLHLQISPKLSIGDMIKAGSVEGQVVEMGLATTTLLDARNIPIFVPNSQLSSKVIVNESLVKCRAMVHKISLKIDDIDKFSKISVDMISMLKSNTNVSLEKEEPYCFLSLAGQSYIELTFGCYLKKGSKKQEETDILVEVVRIIKQHNVNVGT
ncbi:hypothetical protein OROGR_005391 [Orobanche gracilis]